MISREELQEHQETVWVALIDKSYSKKALSPLLELIDWYNNHILTRSLISKKITGEQGEKSLLACNGLLPAEKLVVIGLGDASSVGAAEAKKLTQDLGRVLDDLKTDAPWIVVPPQTSDAFVEELKKSRTSAPTLKQAKISVG